MNGISNKTRQQNLATSFVDQVIVELEQQDAVALGRMISLKNERYKHKLFFGEEAKRYMSQRLETFCANSGDMCAWADVIQAGYNINFIVKFLL